MLPRRSETHLLLHSLAPLHSLREKSVQYTLPSRSHAALLLFLSLSLASSFRLRILLPLARFLHSLSPVVFIASRSKKILLFSFSF